MNKRNTKLFSDSGGDFEIIVASDKDDKVRPIREAFQTVFGKATVVFVYLLFLKINMFH